MNSLNGLTERWFNSHARAPEPCPLSYCQRDIWSLSTRLPELASGYNIPIALQLIGPLDPGRLQRSLDGLVSQHPILRTCCECKNGDVWQRVDPQGSVRINFVDLNAYEQVDRLAEARRRARALYSQPFDLMRAQLMRCCVYKVADELHIAALSISHFVADGPAISLLLTEWTTLYNESDMAPPVPSQIGAPYSIWSSWHRAVMNGPTGREQMRYWRHTLAGARPSFYLKHLKSYGPDEHHSAGYAGVSRMVELPGDSVAHLRSLGRSLRSTPYMILMACWQLLLYHLSHECDITVITPSTLRDEPFAQRLLGCLWNDLLIRCVVAPAGTFAELVCHVRQRVLQALANRLLPYSLVVQSVQPDPDLHEQYPFYEFCFYHEQTPPTFRDVAATVLPVDDNIAWYDLSLRVIQGPGRITVELRYCSDLFTTRDADFMLRYWLQLIAVIVKCPEEPIRKFEPNAVLEQPAGELVAPDYFC